MTDPETGLRARKRARTRRAIVLAAVRIAEERGIDGATIEEIARAADVSPRTFFNYFASKDEVLAGTAPHLPDAAAVDAFVAGRGPLLEDLADLLAVAADAADADSEISRIRQSLVARHPQLAAARLAGMRHFEDELVEVVVRRMSAEAAVDPAAPDVAELRSRASVLVLAVTGVIRHAVLGWARDGGAVSLGEAVRASAATLALVIRETPAR